MGYIRVKHRCDPPPVLGSGDIWECGKCGQQWKSYAPGNPDYACWRKVFWKRKRAS
jgi:ribosomal protein L37AE/L43A